MKRDIPLEDLLCNLEDLIMGLTVSVNKWIKLFSTMCNLKKNHQAETNVPFSLNASTYT